MSADPSRRTARTTARHAPRRRNRPHRKASTRCAETRKRRFRDHHEACDALHAAQNTRRAVQFEEPGTVTTRRRETRAYPCSRCRGWHLTSQRIRQPT